MTSLSLSFDSLRIHNLCAMLSKYSFSGENIETIIVHT